MEGRGEEGEGGEEVEREGRIEGRGEEEVGARGAPSHMSGYGAEAVKLSQSAQ